MNKDIAQPRNKIITILIISENSLALNTPANNVL
jgi:hypothetical protein